MNDRTSKLLLDAYLARGDMMSFVDGVTLAAYNESSPVRSAVERQIEIAAEALAKAIELDPSVEALLPEYHEVRGMRNRLAHDYERTDTEVVWNAAKNRAPVLRERLGVIVTGAGWGHVLDADA